MFIFIDPSVYNEIRITLLFPDRETRAVVTEANRELLRVVSECLERERVSVQDVSGVAILMGTGSFSSTRIASVVGNAFAYALHVPIVGIMPGGEVSFQSVEDYIASADIGTYLSPTYSGEPNIGTPTSL